MRWLLAAQRFLGRPTSYSSRRLMSVRREIPSASAARVWFPLHSSRAFMIRSRSSVRRSSLSTRGVGEGGTVDDAEAIEAAETRGAIDAGNLDDGVDTAAGRCS